MNPDEEKVEYLEIPLIAFEPSKIDNDQTKRFHLVKISKANDTGKLMFSITSGLGNREDIILEPEVAMAISFLIDHVAKDGLVADIEGQEGRSLRSELDKDKANMYG